MTVFSIRDLSYYFRKWPSFLPSGGFCWQFVIFFFFLDIMLTVGKDQPCMCHRLKTGVIVSTCYLVSPFVGSLKSACPSWLRFSPWVSSDLRSDPSSATEEPWDLGRSPWPLLNLSLLKYWWKHLTPWPPRRRMLDRAHKHLTAQHRMSTQSVFALVMDVREGEWQGSQKRLLFQFSKCLEFHICISFMITLKRTDLFGPNLIYCVLNF